MYSFGIRDKETNKIYELSNLNMLELRTAPYLGYTFLGLIVASLLILANISLDIGGIIFIAIFVIDFILIYTRWWRCSPTLLIAAVFLMVLWSRVIWKMLQNKDDKKELEDTECIYDLPMAQKTGIIEDLIRRPSLPIPTMV